jgi:hypothetical protein
LGFLFLGIVVTAMVVYPNIILTTKGEMDEFGIVIVPPTEAQ